MSDNFNADGSHADDDKFPYAYNSCVDLYNEIQRLKTALERTKKELDETKRLYERTDAERGRLRTMLIEFYNRINREVD